MKKSLLFVLGFILYLGIMPSSAQTTLPYVINFGQSQAGWTAVDKSVTTGTTWEYKTGNFGAYIQGQYVSCVSLGQDYKSACDDYYVSPEFALEQGKTYTAEIYVFNATNGNGSVLTFRGGLSSNDVTTYMTFRQLTLDDSSEYPAAQKVSFGAPSTGNYKFAFHSTSPQNNNTIYLFEFKLYEGTELVEEPEEVVKTVPYSVDLKTDYADWTAVDNNGDDDTWTPLQGMGPMLGMILSGQHDDDYFSPQITLKGGTTYKITTNVTVGGTPAGYDIVTLTQGTDKTQMTAIKQLTLGNNGENIEENFFTPATDGNYYFSFHNTSAAGGNYLQLYSFAIEEYVPETPDETEEDSWDFSGANPLQGWTIIDANADGQKWGIIDGYNGPTYNGTSVANDANDWLITPALTLDAGKNYLVRYSLTQAGAFDADQIEIKWGTAPTVQGMSNYLTTETIDLESGTIEKAVRLPATATGQVYIGFHVISPALNGAISLDWIKLLVTEKATPNPVENLEGASDYNAKSVTLKWRNPAFDTSNAPITSGLNIKIYADGVNIATLEGREAGADDSYTYNPVAFGGVVAYRVTATIDGVESLPQEIKIDLDDVQGELALEQEFPLATETDFGDWTIENVNGGATWGYVAWGPHLSLPTNNQEEHNDWAITPGVVLDSAKRYVVRFEVSTSQNYPGNLKVWFGDDKTNTAMTKELLSLENICYNGSVQTTTPQFSVEQGGTYYIGFQAGQALNGMILKNVMLCYISTGGAEVPVMEIPYTQNFDANTMTPEGWKISRSSDEYGFNVLDVSSAAAVYHRAPSRDNALFSKVDAPAGREEVIYTPKFLFETGKSYQVSFMLHNTVQATSGRSLNTVSMYKATAQNTVSIVGDALLETNQETGMVSWVEQKVELNNIEGEYVFVIKVTNDNLAGEIGIDNFKVEEIEKTQPDAVTPAAIEGLRGGKITPDGILLSWSQPLVDVDGNAIPEGSVIVTSIYDGNTLIGTTEKTVSGTGNLASSFQYSYNESEYSGQKIFKCIPSIGDKVCPNATTCVVTISSFTDGYLKEHISITDFAAGTEGWTIIDNDNDNTTWKNETDAVVTTGKDEWLISPELTLNPGKSYYILCELMTSSDKAVNVTFTRGNGATVAAQTETVYKFENLILSSSSELEVGTTFNPSQESNYVGVHVENTDGSEVKIKSLKVMRLMTSDEPVALPYEEDFEDRLNINERTKFPNKWGCSTSSAEPFSVRTMPDNTVAAHSGSYAAVANEFTLNSRIETLYTPYFTLEEGSTYEISYWLYMPGNGANVTTAGLCLAYVQDQATGYEELLQDVGVPVTAWTQFSARYTPSTTMDYCFYLIFAADAANAGIIAVDDFKITEVEGTTGIADVNTAGMYYAHTTSLLYLPAEIESVRIFNMQGQQVLVAGNTGTHVSLAGLNSGVYVVKAITTAGNVMSLKVIKK